MAALNLTNCVEENELLNGSGSKTSIKMQDAPFDHSRTGSEEDILEYEESTVNCDSCRRKRGCTSMEKSLVVFGLVCLIVIIALAVAVGKKKEEKAKIVCESPGCLKAASSIIQAMDPNVDPCDDFHQYACGGWLQETPIPPGYPIWDRFQELSHKNLYMLKSYIETHTLYGKAQQNVRRFYESCMDESKVSRDETLTDFRNLLSEISPDTGEFDMVKSLVEAHKLAIWPLFQLMVGPDERNPENNVIKIEAGASPFPYGLFKDGDENENKDTVTSSVLNAPSSTTTPAREATPVPTSSVVMTNGTSDGNGTDPGYHVVKEGTNASSTTLKDVHVSTTQPPPSIKHTHPHPVENASDLVEEYLMETTRLLVTLWNMKMEAAEREALLIFQLEKRLSIAHDINFHVHNRTQAYNAMKTTALQQKCSMIDWDEYLSHLMGSQSVGIKHQEEVIVLHETALTRVCTIVAEYNSNSTLKPILRRYILLNVARSLKPYFDMNTFQADIDPDEEIEMEGEHWRRCTFYTNKAFGFATGSIYVNATSAVESFKQVEERIKKVRDLIEHVKTAFKEYLLRKIWLDPTTKGNAAAKIDEMIDKISYPSFILNTTFLDEYYKRFVVEKDWFKNLLNWRKFVIRNMVITLSEKFDRQKSWINPPVTVASDYSPVRNDLIFPIALFHLPIFSPEGPASLNFGAIGSLIGHEITHAFDIRGRQYDGYGRLRDWWDPVTAGMFNVTTRCMKDQYDHFTIGNMTINGEQTLEENIADNGGLRAAHIAYELWMDENGEEAPLPGVSLTNTQIFYISYAQLYCSKWKDSGIKKFLMKDTHSPGPFRIEGALSNNQAFQDTFQCSNMARYNPPIKCQVW